MDTVASCSIGVPFVQFNVSSFCILILNRISYAGFYKGVILTASVEIRRKIPINLTFLEELDNHLSSRY